MDQLIARLASVYDLNASACRTIESVATRLYDKGIPLLTIESCLSEVIEAVLTSSNELSVENVDNGLSEYDVNEWFGDL